MAPHIGRQTSRNLQDEPEGPPNRLCLLPLPGWSATARHPRGRRLPLSAPSMFLKKLFINPFFFFFKLIIFLEAQKGPAVFSFLWGKLAIKSIFCEANPVSFPLKPWIIFSKVDFGIAALLGVLFVSVCFFRGLYSHRPGFPKWGRGFCRTPPPPPTTSGNVWRHC